MKQTDLSKYNNSWYKPGNIIARTIWYWVNALVFNHALLPISAIKVFLLKCFGAQIGKGVVIKPSVNIKYPWKLSIDDNTWIGERVWIDNLDTVKIGANCCLSQGVLLLCGNHNYTNETFDLMIGTITLEEGAWIGAKSIVTGNTLCKSHSVLAINSVASSNLEAYSIYRGNPAIKIKDRVMK